MDTETGQSPPWLTEQLRLTSFTKRRFEDVNDSQGAWWTRVIDEEPDSVSFQPKSGLAQRSGSLRTGELSLMVRRMPLVRVDWNWHPKEPGEWEDFAFPVVGPFDSTLEDFSELMSKWLTGPSLPETQRLAFGAVLLQPTDSKELANAQLNRFLPHVEVDQDSSDFIFQINRPRQSTIVDGLLINRLSHWSAARFSLQTVSFDQELRAVTAAEAPEPQYAVRLSLDINTALPSPIAISQEQQQELFSELTALGSEIVMLGDVS